MNYFRHFFLLQHCAAVTNQEALRQPCPGLLCFQVILDLIWYTILHQPFFLTHYHFSHRRLYLSTLLLIFFTWTGEQPLIVPTVRKVEILHFYQENSFFHFHKQNSPLLALSEKPPKIDSKTSAFASFFKAFFYKMLMYARGLISCFVQFLAFFFFSFVCTVAFRLFILQKNIKYL